MISDQGAARTASSGRPKGRYAAANHETENRQASWHSCNAQTLSHLQRPNRCDHRQHRVKEQSVCITSSAHPTLSHPPHIRSQDQRQQGSERRGLQTRKPSKQSESIRAQVLSLAIQITHKLVDASVSKRNSLLPLDTQSIPHTQKGSPCCAGSFLPSHSNESLRQLREMKQRQDQE